MDFSAIRRMDGTVGSYDHLAPPYNHLAPPYDHLAPGHTDHLTG